MNFKKYSKNDSAYVARKYFFVIDYTYMNLFILITQIFIFLMPFAI
jgi:hypothetical protein